MRASLRGLHPAQQEIFTSPARFRVVDAGRRFGKSRLAIAEAFKVLLAGGRCWWVSPNYPMSEAAWSEITYFARPFSQYLTPSASHRALTQKGVGMSGGLLQMKSADAPDSLRGTGLDLVIMDEAAFCAPEVWNTALRPTLSDRRGRAMFISTPKGRNYFWQLYNGASDKAPDSSERSAWQRWKFPTSVNPFIPKEEIEDAKAKMPERIFLQEYMAEFIDDAGLVFRRVADASTGVLQNTSIPGHDYVFGVDWGKLLDFTVISVIDCKLQSQVYMERFNQIDYALQVQRISDLAKRFKPVCIVAESNAMGEPIIEQLQREGLPVLPFLTTAASKKDMIESLELAIERLEIKLLNDETQTGELLAYESERLPSGIFRYSAPAGCHDDTVIALALAWSYGKLYIGGGTGVTRV